jgi:hypothetical protein
MVRFKARVNKVNPYGIVRETLGKEKKETVLPHPYGIVGIREWDGVIVNRSIDYDFEKRTFVMTDEVIVDESKFPELVKKLREEGVEEIIEEKEELEKEKLKKLI